MESIGSPCFLSKKQYGLSNNSYVTSRDQRKMKKFIVYISTKYALIVIKDVTMYKIMCICFASFQREMHHQG